VEPGRTDVRAAATLDHFLLAGAAVELAGGSRSWPSAFWITWQPN